MKLRNNIGWCDVTGNMVIGCSKVSPGCAGCYALSDTPARVYRHRGIETWGAAGVRMPVKGFAAKVRRLNRFLICDACRELVRVEVDQEPYHGFRDAGGYCGGELRRIRIFANSNSDWLDEKWPIETLADFLGLIHECANLDWQLLTKRPELWSARLHEAFAQDSSGDLDYVSLWLDGDAPSNVWLGTSVENQKYADERVPELLQIPAAVRFLSCEPLLGPVDLGRPREGDFTGDYSMRFQRGLFDIHWLICGGESGPKARPLHPDWARSLRDQCAAAGVPFYFKQWGEWAIEIPHAGGDLGGDMRRGVVAHVCAERENDGHFRRGDIYMRRVGHKRAGRLLDGKDYSEFPKAQEAIAA